MLPAFVRKHYFENCIKTKSCPEELPRPPARTDYTYFGPLYRTWNLQNRWEKCVFLVYAPSLEALFAILCSTACILHDIFTFSQCFRHHFAEKWTLLSEVTSHKYVKANTASRICRTGVAMISLSWSRRLWTAYCLQYDMSYMCRHDVFILESPFLNCILPARWYVVYMSPWCLHPGVADFELHTACNMICRIHVAMMSSSWSRRLRIACFLSPTYSWLPGMNWRAVVCPPQRAFN